MPKYQYKGDLAMSTKDILSICYSIIISVGGAGIIICAAASFFGGTHSQKN